MRAAPPWTAPSDAPEHDALPHRALLSPSGVPRGVRLLFLNGRQGPHVCDSPWVNTPLRCVLRQRRCST